MNYYFIDYENVHADGFSGAESLKQGDIVCVMYTDQSKNVSFDVIEMIQKRGAVIESYRTGTGSKNALDFQLSSYLGYVIAKNENKSNHYYIVSADNGYIPVVDFWKERGIVISRCTDLAGTKNPVKSTGKSTGKKSGGKARRSHVAEENLATKDEVLSYLSEEEYTDGVLDIINRYKSKQAINNALTKEFKDTKKGGAVYKKLKTLLKEKKKS